MVQDFVFKKINLHINITAKTKIAEFSTNNYMISKISYNSRLILA